MANAMPSTMPRHMLDHLKIAKAHVVGLSQGRHSRRRIRPAPIPDRALSLTLAGVGSGGRARRSTSGFKKDATTTAARIRTEGMAAYARGLTTNPTRSRFRQKDPRVVFNSVRRNIVVSIPDAGFGAHHGSSFQGKSAVALRFRGRRGRRFDLPTLIICGDEDEPCLQPSLYLKLRAAQRGASPRSPRPATQ